MYMRIGDSYSILCTHLKISLFLLTNRALLGHFTLNFFFIFSKVLGPLDENEFQAEDFDLLEKITYSTSAEKIKALVKEMGNTSKR